MKSIVLLTALWMFCSQQGLASDRTFTIVTNTAVLNHWPNGDGLIGNADDIVSTNLSANSGSSPNQYGTYSYIVTSLGLSTAPDPLLFGLFDTATFVLGFITIDTELFVTNDIPAVKALQLSGTELFPGHGPYSLKLTNRRSGSSSHAGSIYSFDTRYDFEGTFVGGMATATNAQAKGLMVLVDAGDYNTPNLAGVPDALSAYIRNVAIPLAANRNASGLVCGTVDLDTAGSVPGTPGYFPPLKAYAVVLALDLNPTAELRITGVEFTPGGFKLQWTPLPATTYSIEATDALELPFTTLASNLTQPEYVDPASLGKSARYYRLKTP